ncbi:hypothetical protein ABLT60_14825 [Acinetobacter ursingii]|uniref:hypothetical protein n=1 Tax=Acinetobacter ursingii TaxID=108980 RepID=UPI0032B50BFB
MAFDYCLFVRPECRVEQHIFSSPLLKEWAEEARVTWILNTASSALSAYGNTPKRSLSSLEGVHPDLVKVVNRAIELTQIDFTVIDRLRTKERQAQLLKEKKTITLNST